eukprot:gnl/MRDRNA2_/MRDRNA2_63387_c0_seq2.p1 gnl/MRDRNA2_/MRDRNA2_63387_c0~~gnl/MRDRNA2_/MRDRNA2_63387_c0_seq2.p1  ORF type:complete len:168 (-),score=22.29 gnl/MRDRNA2_/MRDRNA2_63387_c0_seq2:143-646(-)
MSVLAAAARGAVARNARMGMQMGPAFALGAKRFCPAMPTGGPHDLNRTVMSPYQGGPVYLWLRSSWIYIRRHVGRHMLRWIDRNWDYQRACMYGCPEMHIDPTKNRWRYLIDNSWYGGMMDKVHEDMCRIVLLYPSISLFCFFCWVRWRTNDKHTFLSKWRVPKEEA